MENHGFDSLSSIEKSLLPEIIEDLMTEQMREWGDLQLEGDLFRVMRFGHIVKGYGRQYRMEELAEWGRKVEAAAQEIDREVLKALLPDFPMMVEKTALAVKKWLSDRQKKD